MSSSWIWEPVNPELNEKLLKYHTAIKGGFIQVGPKKYIYPQNYVKEGPMYYNFKPRPSDVWLVTHPRVGTTMTQEIVWLLTHDFDYEVAAKERLEARSPFLEIESCFPEVVLKGISKKIELDNLKAKINQIEAKPSLLQRLEECKTTRNIKTHLPFSLLNPQLLTCGAKIIYVARNPRDVAPSYYHMMKLFECFALRCTFEEFYELFLKGSYFWGPFWEHIKEGWELRDHPNVLFIFYEELIQDLPKTILRIAEFLNASCDENQLAKLVKHMDRDVFGKNPAVNFEYYRDIGFMSKDEQFVRPQKQEDYTPELEEHMRQWIAENLQGTTLRFPEKL